MKLSKMVRNTSTFFAVWIVDPRRGNDFIETIEKRKLDLKKDT